MNAEITTPNYLNLTVEVLEGRTTNGNNFVEAEAADGVFTVASFSCHSCGVEEIVQAEITE